MRDFATPEEIAEHLRVEVSDVLSLVQQGKLEAIQIGDNIRIPEGALDKLRLTCAANSQLPIDPLPNGSRWCVTRSGRARFKVAGSVAAGAEIWPGKMQYPIRLPRAFMDSLLNKFGGQEIPVGGKFDDTGSGSLGEFIQQELNIKMNPAVYLAALLIEEGYAETSRRGHIRIHSSPSVPK
jgi:excisionase family DNA binding protein